MSYDSAVVVYTARCKNNNILLIYNQGKTVSQKHLVL